MVGLSQTFVLPSSPNHPSAALHQAIYLRGGRHALPSTPYKALSYVGLGKGESLLDSLRQFLPIAYAAAVMIPLLS